MFILCWCPGVCSSVIKHDAFGQKIFFLKVSNLLSDVRQVVVKFCIIASILKNEQN